MEWVKLIVALAIGVFVLDQIGLRLESKGWLYWRKKKPSGGGLGNALQEFEAFLRPSARHVIEVKQKDSKQRDDQGDGVGPAPNN
jgi:hypothetical protein